MASKPRVAISACLLGEAVRYDGRQKGAPELVEALGPLVEWVPVCPEVGAGLGTPREPMHLERSSGELLVLTNETRRNHTAALGIFTSAEIIRLEGLSICGFIAKSRSPSCGLHDVPVTVGGEVQVRGAGYFAGRLAGAKPRLPIADELELAEPAARDRFVAEVRAWARRQGPDDGGARALGSHGGDGQ